MGQRDLVKVVDAEWRRIYRTVTGELGRHAVQVGVVGSEAANEAAPGITLARIAGVHEFGAAIQTRFGVILIPERSFIRSTIAENKNYSSLIAKLVESVLDGRRTEKQALETFGARASADMKKRIAAGIEPPNAPSTIARKGSSKPLIDTGRLRQSITWSVVDVLTGDTKGI